MIFIWSISNGQSIFSLNDVHAQQISIPRIELMPNLPSPYFMRDWKKVGHDYDYLVYNYNAQGDYLPLIFFNNSAINYPGQQSFGLHSFVGTNSPNNSEAINVLPSIVSATLVGIDKRNQNGYDWVKMSREYFNKRPEMNIYKNSPHDDSFDDWWYESMPNVFFYQLYSLYPNVEDYKFQFRSVADRFLEVARLSSGSTTPWNHSNFFYRGWDFVNKQPHKYGVAEPEAAGAVGWILYNAFIETGEKKYLIGAEWCIEFLNSLSANPAYEIQLPYGVFTAARMNAEIGTDYDIEKMFTWCFSKTYLREWNVLLGQWGVYDVNGLIGEDSERQYAFLMNTFQQIGALVPVVRYDERFARTVGKWVLNAANSLRLFYSKFLDDLRQDSEDWSHQYDPNSYIAYEALLKMSTDWPEATGDAKKGNWAKTNLSLYSSSSVGYLAGLLDTTNIPMILKLDLNKTDFFQKKSYPSYLLFNPYNKDTTVQFSLPEGVYNIYETISNSFIGTGLSSIATVSIPANSALVIVLTPTGGNVEYVLNKLILNGNVVDYNSGNHVSNYSPRIKSLSAVDNTLIQNKSTKIYCSAADKDNNQLLYTWRTDKGVIEGEGAVIDFTAPNDTGSITIKVIVEDSASLKDSSELIIKVVEFINHSPQINSIKALPRKIGIGKSTKLNCNASDLDGDSLIYSWYSIYGRLEQQNADSVVWIAPIEEGNYYIKCSVDDNQGSLVSDSIKVMVRDFSKYSIGTIRAFYSFSGNANDETGSGNNGIISGAVFTKDRFNNSASALYFNGASDKVLVKNSSSLNFQDAITISFWMKLDGLPNKEVYVISHGSYDQRFKVSISNKKLRWTIKTDRAGNGILDLDSESLIEANKLYYCTVTYNGSDAEVWLNSELDSFTSWSGKLLTTNFDLTIAQMLPNDANYNFKGTLDDIRIYDYMLLPNAINALNDLPTNVGDNYKNEPIPKETKLYANYPNPFNPETEIRYQISKFSKVQLKIYDVLGREVTTLVDEYKQPGIYHSTFSILNLPARSDESETRRAGRQGSTLSSGVYLYRLITNDFFQTKKMLLLK
ncbi:MAG: LamG-like jellyroll fold domain-containing protein [Bacteroidota bacterium]